MRRITDPPFWSSLKPTQPHARSPRAVKSTESFAVSRRPGKPFDLARYVTLLPSPVTLPTGSMSAGFGVVGFGPAA